MVILKTEKQRKVKMDSKQKEQKPDIRKACLLMFAVGLLPLSAVVWDTYKSYQEGFLYTPYIYLSLALIIINSLWLLPVFGVKLAAVRRWDEAYQDIEIPAVVHTNPSTKMSLFTCIYLMPFCIIMIFFGDGDLITLGFVTLLATIGITCRFAYDFVNWPTYREAYLDKTELTGRLENRETITKPLDQYVIYIKTGKHDYRSRNFTYALYLLDKKYAETASEYKDFSKRHTEKGDILALVPIKRNIFTKERLNQDIKHLQEQLEKPLDVVFSWYAREN